MLWYSDSQTVKSFLSGATRCNRYRIFPTFSCIDHGPVVIGEKGKYILNDDRIEGDNPLIGFGLDIVCHLMRMVSFPGTLDILVNSFYAPDLNEEAVFEELIGFHGGLGGTRHNPSSYLQVGGTCTLSILPEQSKLSRCFKASWLRSSRGNQATSRVMHGKWGVELLFTELIEP